MEEVQAFSSSSRRYHTSTLLSIKTLEPLPLWKLFLSVSQACCPFWLVFSSCGCGRSYNVGCGLSATLLGFSQGWRKVTGIKPDTSQPREQKFASDYALLLNAYVCLKYIVNKSFKGLWMHFIDRHHDHPRKEETCSITKFTVLDRARSKDCYMSSIFVTVCIAAKR